MRTKIILFLLVIFTFNAYNQEALKILPLGNSITYDNNYEDVDNPRPNGERISYRYRLYQLLTNAGYTFDFIGSENGGGTYFPDTQNGGFPGITIEGLNGILDNGFNSWESRQVSPGAYLNTYLPDIILLHIGTNNISANPSDVSTHISYLNELLNKIDAKSTDIVVVIAQIINRVNSSQHQNATTQYNTQIANLVATRKGQGDKLVLVNMETGAGLNYNIGDNNGTGGDMTDDLHPNNHGYGLMGQQWYNALETYNFRTPVVTAIPSQTVNEGTAFATISLDNYVFDPQDADKDITWTTTSTPVNFNITIDANRIATITPKNINWNGSETITFKATDSGNGNDYKFSSTNVTFTVNAVNDPPVITGQKTVSMNEDTEYTLSLNDLNYTDVDNSAASLTLQVMDGTNYTRTGNKIKPAANFNGTLSVPVKIYDGAAYSNTFNVQVTVVSVNDAPVITGQQALSFNEDEYIMLQLSNLTVTDADDSYPSGFTLKLYGGTNYTLTGSKVTPKLNYNGTLQVPAKVFDGKDSSNIFSIQITVTPVNDVPKMILPLKREVFTDSLYSQNIITSDVDNDPLTLSLVNAPSWISVSSNTLAGTPRKADAGTASFTIRLSDGKVNIDSSFNIEVFVSNYAPDITSTPAITVNEKVRYEYIFRATDKNPEDAVVLNYISKPSWLTFVSGSGLLFGTPGNNEVGKYDIVLLATDGIDTTLQSYSLEVLNVNDIPVITSQKNLLSTKAGTPLEILVTDLLINDPDNAYPGDFRVEIVSGANYTFSGATVTPLSTYKGNLSVAVKVNDGKDWSAPYVISINVLSTPISILHRNNSAKTISKIYPLPASQYINLEFEKTLDIAEVRISNLNGKVLSDKTYEINNSQFTIGVEDLNNGLYIIMVKSGGDIYYSKFVIVKD